MANKINGRTPKEIKQGLEVCIGISDLSKGYCDRCPYIPDTSCRDTLEIDALAYIQQLECERETLYSRVTELCKIAGKLDREATAMLFQLQGFCHACRHNEPGKLIRENEFCLGCMHNFDDDELDDNWQWRGVQEVE